MRPVLVPPGFISILLLLGSCLPPMAGGEFTCPATKPTAVKFQPIGAFAGQAAKLFGDEKLFTVFPGAWNFVRPGDIGHLVPKLVWGSNEFDLDSALSMTGRRLDAGSGPLVFEGASLAQDGRGKFITSAFSVPTLGCWEVTAHFRGADLKVVVDLK